MTDTFQPQSVRDLWFPDDGHWTSPETHIQFWDTRMQGGMDEVICRDFAEMTRAAVRGHLDHWADAPLDRLALIIVLDQFSRSLWRDTPAAYSQDLKATRLVLEGLENGHYHALDKPWERQFYIIAMGHCEGPDHLRRMDLAMDLTRDLNDMLPDSLSKLGEVGLAQAERVRNVIARFGRHPHRNAILGRPSSEAEEAYIAEGIFPHELKPDQIAAVT